MPSPLSRGSRGRLGARRVHPRPPRGRRAAGLLERARSPAAAELRRAAGLLLRPCPPRGRRAAGLSDRPRSPCRRRGATAGLLKRKAELGAERRPVPPRPETGLREREGDEAGGEAECRAARRGGTRVLATLSPGLRITRGPSSGAVGEAGGAPPPQEPPEPFPEPEPLCLCKPWRPPPDELEAAAAGRAFERACLTICL